MQGVVKAPSKTNRMLKFQPKWACASRLWRMPLSCCHDSRRQLRNLRNRKRTSRASIDCVWNDTIPEFNSSRILYKDVKLLLLRASWHVEFSSE